MNKVRSEDTPVYGPITTKPVTNAINKPVTNAINENKIIEQALTILQSRLRIPLIKIRNPDDTIKYLRLKLAPLEHEVFAVLFLDNRHQLIEYEEMFRGTINGASVHPREVVKAALRHNAAAIIIAHNHPSGDPSPSQADRSITARLYDTMKLVDVELLDHIIIGGMDHLSFKEKGYI